MFKKIKEILTGFENYTVKDPEIEKEAQRKAKICASCDQAVKMPLEILRDRQLKSIQGFACNICKCPLSTKLRSPKSLCDLKKF